MILYLISYNHCDIYYELSTKRYIRFPETSNFNNFILINDDWYYTVSNERSMFPKKRNYITEMPISWNVVLSDILLSKIIENI